jgi:hypothetical protein
MFLLRLKVCFFQSVQTDRHPAITYAVARQTGPGRQCENICWMDLLTGSCFYSPFLYFFSLFFLHTVYYVSDLMNLICWHVTPSVFRNDGLTFLFTVLFLAAALPGAPAHTCALGAPSSAGCGWHGWIRQASPSLQDSFFPCCLHVSSPSSRSPSPAWLCNW